MKLVTMTCTVALALGWSIVRPEAALQPQQACLHGDNEAPEQRVRRVRALALARQINTNQHGVALRNTNAFQPIARLELTAPIPEGFDLRLTTDGDTYAFSVRDTTDPCLFGFFSDQQGVIFQGRVIQ